MEDLVRVQLGMCPLLLLLLLSASLTLTAAGDRARQRDHSARTYQEQAPMTAEDGGDDDEMELAVERGRVHPKVGTPYPPSGGGEGLFAVVHNLVQQVAELTENQQHDRARLRRTERRAKGARSDIDVMHADVIQLRQHVAEINAKLDILEDRTSDLELGLTKVKDEQQRAREELGKVRQGQRQLEGRQHDMENKVTETISRAQGTERRLGWMETSLQGPGERGSGGLLQQLRGLGPRLTLMQHDIHALALQVRQHLRPTLLHQTAPPVTSAFATTVPLPGRLRPQHGSAALPGRGRQPAASPRDEGTTRDLVVTASSQRVRDSSAPQSDEAAGSVTVADGEQLTNASTDAHINTGDEVSENVEISGDGELILGASQRDRDVVALQEKLSQGNNSHEAASGDGDEFFLVEDLLPVTEVTAARQNETGSDVSPDAEGGGNRSEGMDLEEDAWLVLPTPHTTDLPTTLTHASPAAPTSPGLTLGQFTELEQRVQRLQQRLEASVHTEDILQVVFNETQRLQLAATRSDQVLQQVRGNVTELGSNVTRLAAQLSGLRLTEFLDTLHSSLLNFTANVLTLDQWGMANQQIMNASHQTQERITQLSKSLQDKAEMMSLVRKELREHQALSERQFRLLQSYVIRLNNSLQDVQEQVERLKDVKIPHNARVILGNGGSGHLIKESSKTAEEEGVGQGSRLRSRLEELGLQLVYNDNRLSHLETQLLNATLAACRKTSSDEQQDAALLRLDLHVSQAQQELVILKESAKRTDLGLYRLHGSSNTNQEATRRLEGQVKAMGGLEGKVSVLRREVDNLLFQLPADCDDYYDRGYQRSSDYVIFPRLAAASVKVRCLMTSGDEEEEGEVLEDGREDKGRGRAERAAGGWTVIQQRHNGKVNFTRSWADYAAGFGSPDTEYWVGNENLHLLTAHRNVSLHIAMTDIFGGRWGATYRHFRVGPRGDHYRLTLGGYHGNATDTMTYAAGMTFSTWDRDTDLSSSPCARYNGAGWWYSHCMISNLNGPYDIGMIWFHTGWRDWLQLRHVVMAIKPLTSS